MKIAILGTRGIPNTYGGFEQCAEIISAYMVRDGHHLTVYNPTDHGFKENMLNGVHIVNIFSNEKKLSFLNVFVFDYLCLRHAVTCDYDVILELGYHPASLFYTLKKQTNAKIITNMAGLEWKRSKWGKTTQKFIRYLEKLAVQKSDGIISDNKGIQEYYLKEYNKDSYMVAYGAMLHDDFEESYLEQYNLEKNNYYMLMARLQPDNNFEMILDGFVKSGITKPFIVVGGYDNKYGKYLIDRYKHRGNIQFIGGLYDYDVLSSLRHFSHRYFHGHASGGTNPSLLEAMATKTFIVAHDNVFNRYVLGDEGEYFSSSDEVAEILSEKVDDTFKNNCLDKNRMKIETEYNWDKIAQQYIDIMNKIVAAS